MTTIDISIDRLHELIEAASICYNKGEMDLSIRYIDQAKRECENIDSKLWKLKSRARGTLTD